jgi:hypothetical protein
MFHACFNLKRRQEYLHEENTAPQGKGGTVQVRGSLSPRYCASYIADTGKCIQIWRISASKQNKQSPKTTSGGTPALELAEGLITPHCKRIRMLQDVTQDIRIGYEEKRQLGRLRRRCEDNFKTNLTDWMGQS